MPSQFGLLLRTHLTDLEIAKKRGNISPKKTMS